MSPFFRRIEKNLYLKQPPQIRPSCQTPKAPDHAVKQQFKRKRTDEKIMQI